MTAVLEASDWLNSQLSNLIPARPSAWTTMYALVNLNIHIHMATHGLQFCSIAMRYNLGKKT